MNIKVYVDDDFRNNYLRSMTFKEFEKIRSDEDGTD